jgi:hypothetical protein
MIKNTLILLATTLFISSCVDSTQLGNQVENKRSSITEVKNLSSVEQTIKSNKLSPKDTLVIYDIDDTLITASHFLGSDRWYNFQLGNARNANGAPLKPAKDQLAKNLFEETIGDTTWLSKSQLSQSDSVEIYNNTPTDKLIITARSNDYRSATLRDLRAEGFKFDEQPLGGEELLYRFKMRNSRGSTDIVQYSSGILMIQGNNKGDALLQLLKKTNRTYKNIVFIDDGMKNMHQMRDALKPTQMNFYGLYYTRISKTVETNEAKKSALGLKKLQDLKRSHFE